MTAAVYRSGTPALSVPQSQNTAPVLEFNCLYTHDIRRKQKRWQDGFLRYHTFNKRIMLYDVPRNFIGDTHWKSSDTLQDGDEVTLERGGVIVQVAENVGRTETDLTELRQSKNKASSEKGSSSPVRPSRAPAPAPSGNRGTPALGLKHRSLNALLGTPKGPIGKVALPAKSPFEERQENLRGHATHQERPAKRPRLEQPASNVERITKTTTKPPKKQLPLWARTADSAKQRSKPTTESGQQSLLTKEVIDLCDDEEDRERFLPGFSSDALAHPSSPYKVEVSRNAPQSNPPVRSSSPAFQVQKVPPRHIEKVSKTTRIDEEDIRSLRVGNTDRAPLDDRDLSRRSRSRGEVDNEALEPTTDKVRLQKSKAAAPQSRPKEASGRAGGTLRIAASAPKKKTLLCQGQLSSLKSTTQRLHGEQDQDDDSLTGSATRPKIRKTHEEQLEERLARIAAKDSKRREGNSRTDERQVEPLARPQGGQILRNKSTELDAPQPSGPSPLQQNALELADLDEMIMPPEPAPVSPVLMADPLPAEPRDLRRVVSDTNMPSASKPKRVPGAPVRITPSPTKKTPSARSSVALSDSEPSPVKQSALSPAPPPAPPPALPPARSRAKKPIQKSVSLNVTSGGTSTVILRKPFKAPKAPSPKAVPPARDPEPWSREAFDLFTWRPPGWNEEKWCVEADTAT